MIDSDPTVVLECLPEVIPEGELACFVQMQRAEGIDVAKCEHGAVDGSRFWLEESIMDPGCRFMTVDVLGNDIEVATYNSRNAIALPFAHLRKKPFHPGQFVLELLRATGLPLGRSMSTMRMPEIMTSRYRACVSNWSPDSALLTDSMGDLERIATQLGLFGLRPHSHSPDHGKSQKGTQFL